MCSEFNVNVPNVYPPAEITVLPKMCRQVQLKNSEIRKNIKLGYFVVKAIRPRVVP